MLLDQAARKQRQQPIPMDRANINNKLSWVLLALVGLSPLPLGSNRPAFWAAWGLLLGAIGVVYFLSLRASGNRLRVQPSRLLELTIPFTLLLLFVAAQILPLGLLAQALPRTLPSSLGLLPSSISLDPATTGLTLLQFASYGLLALLFLQIGYRSGRADRVLIGIFLVIVAYALLGLVLQGQLSDILGLPKSAQQAAATGPFVNRNSYATYLAMGLVLGVALAVGQLESEGGRNRNRHRQLAAIALIAAGLFVIGTALVATQSRMGFSAGLIGSLMVMVLALVRRRATVWLVAFSVLLAGTIGLLVFNGSGLLERVGSLETAGDVRADLYRQVWGMILSSPFVGYGGGTFELVFPLFHQLPVSPDVVWNKAHSTYLSLWVELGFLFGSLPLLIFGAATLRLARSASRGVPRLAAIGVITVAAVHSTVDFSLEIEAVAFTFIAIVFLALGAGIGAGEQRRHHA